MMQREARLLEYNGDQSPGNGTTTRIDTARTLAAFEAHLYKTGKVCPKPWHWRRFCNLFNPVQEPPWLSSWWETSAQEKKHLFLKQIEYLAKHTDRFPAAYRFVSGLKEEYWFISR